jgi:hypothetical protein
MGGLERSRRFESKNSVSLGYGIICCADGQCSNGETGIGRALSQRMPPSQTERLAMSWAAEGIDDRCRWLAALRLARHPHCHEDASAEQIVGPGALALVRFHQALQFPESGRRLRFGARLGLTSIARSAHEYIANENIQKRYFDCGLNGHVSFQPLRRSSRGTGQAGLSGRQASSSRAGKSD